MARKNTEPKRHAEYVTETEDLGLGGRVKRTYAARLKEHALWVDDRIVATAHAVGPAWSVVLGDPEQGDGSHRKFKRLAHSEQDAILFLEHQVEIELPDLD